MLSGEEYFVMTLWVIEECWYKLLVDNTGCFHDLMQIFRSTIVKCTIKIILFEVYSGNDNFIVAVVPSEPLKYYEKSQEFWIRSLLRRHKINTTLQLSFTKSKPQAPVDIYKHSLLSKWKNLPIKECWISSSCNH